MSATHIRLVCWEHRHMQAISPEQLRQIRFAPICTARIRGDTCGSPIWAVLHEGEPTRYVGKPPHINWQGWADCIEPLFAEHTMNPHEGPGASGNTFTNCTFTRAKPIPKRVKAMQAKVDAELRRYAYKPGWVLSLTVAEGKRKGRWGRPPLVLRIRGQVTLPDSSNPSALFPLAGRGDVDVSRSSVAVDVENALGDLITNMESHEFREWFRRDGEPLWDPHKAAG